MCVPINQGSFGNEETFGMSKSRWLYRPWKQLGQEFSEALIHRDYPSEGASELYPLGIAGVVEVELKQPPFSPLFLASPTAIDAIAPADLTTILIILRMTCPLLTRRLGFGLLLGLEAAVSISAGVVEVELREPPFSPLFLPIPPAFEAIAPADFTIALIILSLTCPLFGGMVRFDLLLGLKAAVSISGSWVRKILNLQGEYMSVVEVELREPPFSPLFLPIPPAFEAIAPADFTIALIILSLTCPLFGGMVRFDLLLGLKAAVSISGSWVPNSRRLYYGLLHGTLGGKILKSSRYGISGKPPTVEPLTWALQIIFKAEKL
ncbi:hypothetical protein L1049_012806 [Liquidambar formosana]|uniref:Uncharacterized protein n=1 Tax=Liquidambar formosana TaxID=63359 RepID=A0AAP0WXD5_LIQFO